MNPVISQYAKILFKAGVAGNRTSHGAADNLYKIDQVIQHNPNYTFGLEDHLQNATFEEAYHATASYTGHPPDREENPGRGCIDPASTAAGLLQAGERIRAVAEAGGSFLFGTGHPGAMLFYYLTVARWVEELGGNVRTVDVNGRYEKEKPLDWVGPVAAVGDGASLYHTHSPAPMRDVLEQTGAVDLVVADHGFAGAAVAAGVPAVAVMDTNDPSLAVTARRGADLTIVPIDDNRPQNSYVAAIQVLRGA